MSSTKKVNTKKVEKIQQIENEIFDTNKPNQIYESKNDSSKVVISQLTRTKIEQYKKANAEVNMLLERSKEKINKDNKQELLNQVKDKKQEKQYIEKSFASIIQKDITNPNTHANIDPKNITYDLIDKIKRKSVISPYSETTLKRMEEAFRSDGTVKRGILKKWDFILGADMRIILTPALDYDDRKEKRKMQKAIAQYLPYRTVLNEAKVILDRIDFRQNLYDSGVQSSIYGRGAFEKVRALDNTIVGLNVLETRFMGNPIYLPMNSVTNMPKDSETNKIVNSQIDTNMEQKIVASRRIFWKLYGLEYNDPENILNSNNPDNIEILKMSDLVYILRDNVSVSAGIKGFGLSEIESALDGSETKRIMKIYDFKEISKNSYSSFGIIHALNANITTAELQYLCDSMTVNGWAATAHQIKVETFSLSSDSRIMIEILDTMNRETGRDLDIPSPLLGYEHVQNYASLQQTLQSWKESVLDADRRRIKDIIEKQLLQEILDTSLKRQDLAIKLNEKFQLQLYVLNPETKEPIIDIFTKKLKIATMFYRDPETGIIETIEVPPIKLSFEISDPNFSIFKDKGEIGISLKGINAIGIEKLLELVDMSDEIDDALKRETEEQEKQKQLHEMTIMEKQSNIQNNSLLTKIKAMQTKAEMDTLGEANKAISDDEEQKEDEEPEEKDFEKEYIDKKKRDEEFRNKFTRKSFEVRKYENPEDNIYCPKCNNAEWELRQEIDKVLIVCKNCSYIDSGFAIT